MAFILSLNDTQLTHCKHARNHWAMATAESTMPRLGTCRIDGEYMMQISAKLASFVAAAVYVQWCDVFEGLVTHASKLFFILIPIRLRHCAVLQLETWAMQNTGPCKTLVFDLFLNSDRLVVIITNLRLVAYYQLNFDRSWSLSHFSLWRRQTRRAKQQKMLCTSCPTSSSSSSSWATAGTLPVDKRLDWMKKGDGKGQAQKNNFNPASSLESHHQHDQWKQDVLRSWTAIL